MKENKKNKKFTRREVSVLADNIIDRINLTRKKHKEEWIQENAKDLDVLTEAATSIFLLLEKYGIDSNSYDYQLKDIYYTYTNIIYSNIYNVKYISRQKIEDDFVLAQLNEDFDVEQFINNSVKIYMNE